MAACLQTTLHCAPMQKQGKLNFSKLFNDPEKKDKPTAADMLIVSMGTGSVKKRYRYDDFKRAGEIKWLEPVIDILMSRQLRNRGVSIDANVSYT